MRSNKNLLLAELRALSSELEELRQEAGRCGNFDPLEKKLGAVRQFVLDAENASCWRRWEGDLELLHEATVLRDVLDRALCDLEKDHSRRLCERLAEGTLPAEAYLDATYTEFQRPFRVELAASGVGPRSRIVFIGAGALPVTALLFARESEAELLCHDIDPEATRLANNLVMRQGLAERIRCSSHPLEAIPCVRQASHFIIAALVKEKAAILRQLGSQMHGQAKIILRYGNGIKSLCNYPFEKELSGSWRVTPLIHTGAVYDAVLLERRNGSETGVVAAVDQEQGVP
ncbi:nicotianamine synthase family protein [Sorangium sp. So ce1153]|uniref:nicotianamine synthase family protein n=1 Tax=Sorangium sp. So ce1153 TaxID=3133333 RepID=UPI003F5F0F9F